MYPALRELAPQPRVFASSSTTSTPFSASRSGGRHAASTAADHDDIAVDVTGRGCSTVTGGAAQPVS